VNKDFHQEDALVRVAPLQSVDDAGHAGTFEALGGLLARGRGVIVGQQIVLVRRGAHLPRIGTCRRKRPLGQQ
jgi:hypothetical protein